MLAAGAELSGSLASAVIGACASSVPTFTSTEEEAEAGAGEDNPGSDPGSAESATVASSWTEPGWTEAEAATSEVAANPATTEPPRAAAVPAYTRPTTEASDRQTTKRNPDICEVHFQPRRGAQTAFGPDSLDRGTTRLGSVTGRDEDGSLGRGARVPARPAGADDSGDLEPVAAGGEAGARPGAARDARGGDGEPARRRCRRFPDGVAGCARNRVPADHDRGGERTRAGGGGARGCRRRGCGGRLRGARRRQPDRPVRPRGTRAAQEQRECKQD